MSKDIKRLEVPSELCALISDKRRLDLWLIDLCTFISNGVGSSFHFSRDGNVSGWLRQGVVFSNEVGIPFGFLNGLLQEIWIGSKSNIAVGRSIEIWEHDGDLVGASLLVTQAIPGGSNTFTFDTDDFGTVNITQDKQLAVKIVGGNIQRPTVFLRPTGKRDV